VYENPLHIVRECKGAALSILIILGLVHQTVSQEFLQRWSGYTDKPISQALTFLEEGQLIIRCRGGWRLSDGATQLPLVGCLDKSRNNSDSVVLTTTTMEGKSKIEGKLAVAEEESRNNSESCNYKANLEAMHQLGIFDNPTTRSLAGLKHVTPEYVIAHVTQALGEGQTLGLAIYRMRAGDPIPATRRNGHGLACDCETCHSASYMDWEDLK